MQDWRSAGIYESNPAGSIIFNDKLHLTAAEAAAMSPVLQLPKRKIPATMAFGLAELPELQRQSRAYHQARLDAACRAVCCRSSAQSFLDHG